MEWGKLIGAANTGNGMAVDHLIDARLKNELPPNEAQSFAESCFMYWMRDEPYTKEDRETASLHDPEEAPTTRDAQATRMDFRFIEAAHMARLLGVGLEGVWDVSVTFHPYSSTTVRVNFVQQAKEAASEDGLYSRTRLWMRSGYKLVREWKRARITSARQTFSDPRFERKAAASRCVPYRVRCLTSQEMLPKGNPVQSAASGLTLRICLVDSGVAEEIGSSANVLRVAAEAVCTASSVGGLQGGVLYRGQLDLYGGSFCSLADWSSRDDGDSIDAQHGDSTIRCIRSEALSGAAEVSDIQLSTCWLLQAKGMHTFRASVRHEIEPGSAVAKEGRILGRMKRLFRETAAKTGALVINDSISIYVSCDLDFAHFLHKLGMMRRVRDSASTLVKRSSVVGASARF